MIKEQRQSKRLASESVLYYTFPGNIERYEGRCVNLSDNGILLESGEQVPPEAAIHICLYSGNETTLPLNLLVKVIWLKKLSNGQYHAGAIIKAIMAEH